MLPRPSFSVVVTAHNEALTIPKLAESLEPFLSAGGEFLVVDTGSDDDTVQVAKASGARVVEVGRRFHSILSEAQAAAIDARFSRGGEGPLVEAGQVLFDFGRAREFASGCASNEFVWHIDASDVIESADYAFLGAEVRSGEADCFDYFLSNATALFRIARFFDRRCFEWRGRVHEVPVRREGAKVGRRVICTEQQLALRHDRQSKSRTYLAGLALEVLDKPTEPRWVHYLGRELQFEQRYRSAIAVLHRHIRLPDGRPADRGRSFCIIGMCLEELGRPVAASASYFRASQADTSRRTPLLRLALLCQKRGDFQGSVTFAAAALMVPRSNAYIDANESAPADPHALLYWGLFWLGRRDEAKAHWEACRQMAPQDQKYADDGRLFAGHH